MAESPYPEQLTTARAVAAAESSAAPALSDSRWIANPGYDTALVYVTTATADPTCVVSPYLRVGQQLANAFVARAAPQTVDATVGDAAFFLPVYGADILAAITTLAGGHTATVNVAWLDGRG